MRKTFSIFLIVVFALLVFSFVYGAPKDNCPACPSPGGIVPCGRSCDDSTTARNECKPCELCDVFVMVNVYITGFLKLVVPSLATIMIAIGGMMLIFGTGKPETVSQAKSLLKAVIIGLIIIYGAWLIVDVLLSAFSVNKSFLQSWNTICQ